MKCDKIVKQMSLGGAKIKKRVYFVWTIFSRSIYHNYNVYTTTQITQLPVTEWHISSIERKQSIRLFFPSKYIKLCAIFSSSENWVDLEEELVAPKYKKVKSEKEQIIEDVLHRMKSASKNSKTISNRNSNNSVRRRSTHNRQTPFFIGRTHFCTTNLGILYFSRINQD